MKRRTAITKRDATAKDVHFVDRFFVIVLTDGREISIPLSFYPTLAKANSAQRSQFEIFGSGGAIAWENLNLYLCVQFLLKGAREGIPKPPPMKLIKSQFRGRSRKLIGNKN